MPGQGAASRIGRGHAALWLAAAVLGLGYVACLVANLPGHFPPDAIWQLAQGREGRFDDWHPPVMAWLLGLADRLAPGAGAAPAA